ncbi:hypothetical protein Dimus_000789, partial [Dionaea muscipula]
IPHKTLNCGVRSDGEVAASIGLPIWKNSAKWRASLEGKSDLPHLQVEFVLAQSSSSQSGIRQALNTRKIQYNPSGIVVARSILTERDFEEISLVYPLPDGWRFRLPRAAERPLNPSSPNTFAVHFDSLKVGLRFPLHPFAEAILQNHDMLPCQLHPNSWMIITSYIIRCNRAGAEASIPMFYKLFKLTDNRDECQISTGYFSFVLVKGGYGVVEMKSNVKFWKVKFLFISTLPAEFPTQPRVMQLSPKFPIKDVLNAEEESLRDMFSTKTLMAPKWESIISLSTLEK